MWVRGAACWRPRIYYLAPWYSVPYAFAPQVRYHVRTNMPQLRTEVKYIRRWSNGYQPKIYHSGRKCKYRWSINMNTKRSLCFRPRGMRQRSKLRRVRTRLVRRQRVPFTYYLLSYEANHAHRVSHSKFRLRIRKARYALLHTPV